MYLSTTKCAVRRQLPLGLLHRPVDKNGFEPVGKPVHRACRNAPLKSSSLTVKFKVTVRAKRNSIVSWCFDKAKCENATRPGIKIILIMVILVVNT